jgi:hypothetical protein
MIEKVICLSFVTGSISYTFTETKLFRPLRDWTKNQNHFFGELFGCGYCVGHWVAFGLVAIYRPKLFETWWLMDYFLTALTIAWLSAFQWVLMCWFMNKAGK